MSPDGLNELLSRYLIIGIVAGMLLGGVIGIFTGGYGFWIGTGCCSASCSPPSSSPSRANAERGQGADDAAAVSCDGSPQCEKGDR